MKKKRKASRHTHHPSHYDNEGHGHSKGKRAHSHGLHKDGHHDMPSHAGTKPAKPSRKEFKARMKRLEGTPL